MIMKNPRRTNCSFESSESYPCFQEQDQVWAKFIMACLSAIDNLSKDDSFSRAAQKLCIQEDTRGFGLATVQQHREFTEQRKSCGTRRSRCLRTHSQLLVLESSVPVTKREQTVHTQSMCASLLGFFVLYGYRSHEQPLRFLAESATWMDSSRTINSTYTQKPRQLQSRRKYRK